MRKMIVKPSHKAVIEASYNRLTDRQKALFRNIVLSAMLSGSYDVIMYADNVCAMYDIKDAKALFNELKSMYSALMINDFYVENNSFNYKWFDSIYLDEKEKIVIVAINHLVFACMRLHYDDKIKGLALEVINDEEDGQLGKVEAHLQHYP